MAGATDELRVLSYNVRSLRDDRHAVAAVIRACAPDVVCVQEAPRFLRWRTKCAELARESGLYVVTGGRDAGAMLLLGALRLRIRRTADVRLSKTPRLHQRGLAIGAVEVGGARYTIASMHLGLTEAERRRHVDELLYKLADFPDPLVLAGDVNETPDRPTWSVLASRLQDGYATAPRGGEFTYSAVQPHKRIDGVFVDHALEVVECGVPDVAGIARASDHCPLLAVVRPRRSSGGGRQEEPGR